MTAAPRIAASPYARRLARERGISLAALRGSGPSGRIVAFDINRHVPTAPPAAVVSLQVAAIATRIELGEINAVLQAFAAAKMDFDLDDLVLRAAGCALDAADAATDVPGAPIAYELAADGRRWQAVLNNVLLGSLAPLRVRRLAALAVALDQSAAPAALSIRILPPSPVRPVLMPLSPNRAMRLVLAPDLPGTAAECLLSFDPQLVDEAVAAKFLTSFRDHLEVPLRLLA
jgi:pyruvate/2-oxoglutarate dehydrogenase complex dihydrolipoamide acyltransferase (E2) component